MELDRRGAELFFQVLTEREEKNSIAIASNESFFGWTKTFTAPRLCAANVDRLTFNGAIIETGTPTDWRTASRKRAPEYAFPPVDKVQAYRFGALPHALVGGEEQFHLEDFQGNRRPAMRESPYPRFGETHFLIEVPRRFRGF